MAIALFTLATFTASLVIIGGAGLATKVWEDRYMARHAARLAASRGCELCADTAVPVGSMAHRRDYQLFTPDNVADTCRYCGGWYIPSPVR